MVLAPGFQSAGHTSAETEMVEDEATSSTTTLCTLCTQQQSVAEEAKGTKEGNGAAKVRKCSGRTSVLAHKLDGLHQAQRLVHRAAHRQVVDGDLLQVALRAARRCTRGVGAVTHAASSERARRLHALRLCCSVRAHLWVDDEEAAQRDALVLDQHAVPAPTCGGHRRFCAGVREGRPWQQAPAHPPTRQRARTHRAAMSLVVSARIGICMRPRPPRCEYRARNARACMHWR